VSAVGIGADIVVIGAGHNALIAAAYLIRAGLSVAVVEERETVGGGTSTGELIRPGFLHDEAASAHIALQYNPMLVNDELGLLADGLRYVHPDPVFVYHCADGDTITMHRDLDRTTAEFERFSARDAEAYRTLVADWLAVVEDWVRMQTTAPDRGGPPPATFLELATPSLIDAVEARFADDRIRSMLLWLAGQGGQAPDQPGTAFMLAFFAGALSQVSWPNAVGGSQALADSLVGVIVAGGGTIHCGRRVTRIEVTAGRATAVLTATGERFAAGQAVLSSASVVHLPELLGSAHPLPDDFARLGHWRHGHSQLVIHLALEETPRYRTSAGERPVTLAGYGTAAGLRQQALDLDAGRRSATGRMFSAICATEVDPTRAPAGCATLKFVTPAPYALDGDPRTWDSAKDDYARTFLTEYQRTVQGYTAGGEVGMVVHSPLDLERRNRQFVAGGFTGGEMSLDQMGPNRPVPGWASYRMPIDGLYQTGASTHPGGGVSGFPGRNAAATILADLGHSGVEP
jgi:phytoene dehydrogenase-like protein